ncbi:Amino-transferase class IV [uncultured archaeon]|nr:Amino-transferase class IV [uncultured archaeon]
MASKQYIWFDGKFVDFGKANVHVLTHSLQYGSGIFEGIRAYRTARGAAVFRLEDHVNRLFNSAKIYDMDLGVTQETVSNAIVSTIRKNGLGECYVRPFSFYNDARIGVNPIGRKISTIIAAIPFGNYFQNKDRGISCKISSWQRINSMVLPPQAKASGNYLNSVLASLEARRAGADEAIMLSGNGYVAEGSGENIFLVNDNKIITPSAESDILLGITRGTIIELARSLGMEVEERNVHREELFTSSEVFFTGTAAEITPITRIDSKRIGRGHIGPIAKMLSDNYSLIVKGENKEFEGWLTYVGK